MTAMTPSYTQTGFRIRSGDDTALNTDSGWAAAEDINATIDAHVRFRIRFAIEETAGNGANNNFKIQYRRNGGTWTDAVYYNLAAPGSTINGTPIVWVGESFIYADGDSTSTQLLSSATQTFDSAAPGGCETPTSNSHILDAESGEYEWTIVIPTFWDDGTSYGQNVDADTFEFRVVEGDGTVFAGTYVNPTVTLNVPNNYIGGTFAESPHVIGPFVDDNNNMYYLCEFAETTGRTVMLKSTDNGVTWAVVDDAGAPVQNDLESADIYQDGDTLHIAHQPGDAYYHTFNMSSAASNADSWVITDEIIASGTTQTQQGTAIFPRSDGTIVVFYNNNDGTFDRVRYKIRSSGGTWGSEQNVDTTASTNFNGVAGCFGTSETIHIFYKDESNGDIYHNTLSSSDVLGTRQSVETDAGTSVDYRVNLAAPVYYDDGGVEVICVAYVDASDDLLYTRYLRNGTLQTRSAASDNTCLANHVAMNSRKPAATLGVNGKVVHLLYSDLSTHDIYYDTNDDEGGWGTDTEQNDGVNAACVCGRIITRGGTTYFGYFYEDSLKAGTFGGGSVTDPYSGYTGGTVYAEIELASGPFTQAVSGTVTSSGTVKKKTFKTFSGVVSSAGTIVKKIFETLTGAITPTGDVATQSRFTRALAGTVTSAGTVVKKTSKTLTGAVTSAGIAKKKTAKVLVGVVTSAGSISKKMFESLVGTITSAGDLIRQSRFTKALAGVVSSSGTVIKKTSKSLVGSVASAGDLAKKSFMALAGTITSAGSLVADKLGGLYFHSVSGVVGSSGDLVKKTSKGLVGSVTSAGELVKKTSKNLAGTVTSAGAIIKKTFKSLVGTVTSAGDLVAIKLGSLYFQSVAGTVASSGELVKKTSKSLVGTVTSAGDLARKISKTLGGTISATGTVVKKTFRSLAGTVTSSGILTPLKLGSLYFQSLAGVVTSSGSIIKKTSKSMYGIITSAGVVSISSTFHRSLAGAVTSSGNLAKKTSKGLSGVVTSTGSLAKRMFLILAGSVTSSGSLATALNPLLFAARKVLTLPARTFTLSLGDRTLTFNLWERKFSLSLEDRDIDIT